MKKHLRTPLILLLFFPLSFLGIEGIDYLVSLTHPNSLPEPAVLFNCKVSAVLLLLFASTWLGDKILRTPHEDEIII